MFLTTDVRRFEMISVKSILKKKKKMKNAKYATKLKKMQNLVAL